MNAPGPASRDHDVVVVAQKVVSKAEGRYVDLADIEPGERALALSVEVQKDPRLVEVILGNSRRVLRHSPGVLIVEHRLGFVLANAGVDQSNVDPGRARSRYCYCRRDPDASAQRLHEGFAPASAKTSASSLMTVSGGPGGLARSVWHSGPPAFRRCSIFADRPDLYGRPLQVSETGFADEIAAAASLLMGQADEATPVVVVRGLTWSATALAGGALLRDPEEDLFR